MTTPKTPPASRARGHFMQYEFYRLPDGRIVPIDATASRGARTINFTLKGGAIVEAIRCGRLAVTAADVADAVRLAGYPVLSVIEEDDDVDGAVQVTPAISIQVSSTQGYLGVVQDMGDDSFQCSPLFSGHDQITQVLRVLAERVTPGGQ